MDIKRVLRHLTTTSLAARRAFPAPVLAAIAQAIQASEQTHGGQIRFVVEACLDGMSLWRGQAPHERALELFAQLHVWDTEHNSGVLVYVLLADRAVEIIADRGIHARGGAQAWSQICRAMEAHFARAEFEQGALAGLAAVSQLLQRHYPRKPKGGNELPDEPLVL